MEIDNLIKNIKKITGNSSDVVIREINIKKNKINIIFIESLSSSNDITESILKRLTNLDDIYEDIYTHIYNMLPASNISKINTIEEVIKNIYNGFTVLIIDSNKYIAIESKATLDRGINSVENEFSMAGPKDGFTENVIKNIGLVRKRLRTPNLYIDTTTIGKEGNNKIAICYMSNIASNDLITEVKERLNDINIDAILDSGYINEKVIIKSNIFPVTNITERPDTAAQGLLEGKVILLLDNSPYAIIVPTFFTDFLHTPDDYYQKSTNITFVRLLRTIAFFISIFLPAYYISITTNNFSSIPLTLLINFTAQRQLVPFPAFFEAIAMIICFEILRESDIRIPSKTGTSVSILGGLILGSAAVEAGIISPIMIIVIAISAIGALVFTSPALINAIRYYRLLILMICIFFGIYGLFIGLTLLITNLSSITSFGYPYTSPISPIIKEEISDSIIKTTPKQTNNRNPLLAEKNIIRGKCIWKNYLY